MNKTIPLLLVLALIGWAPAQSNAEEKPALPKVILTPKPAAAPRINGPAIFGVRPSSPFLYAIPATGDRPMTFAAEGLPEGLTLDAATGRISGSVATAGEHRVTLRATNAQGKAEKAFRIVIGEKIALTPPMGWNSWNCWGDSVNQEKVLGSAKALVAKGLDQHGWTYVNIDDGWQGVRGGPDNAIQPNSKFTDLKALADEIHGLGLKFGVYSTPWTISYAGHIGSASFNADGTYDWIKKGNHNKDFKNTWPGFKKAPNGKVIQPEKAISFATQDATQWAQWGVDYLKYDWYPNDVANTETMSTALRKSGRDVVLSLSNTAPFEFAADWERLAQAWRTTGDIYDNWKSVCQNGFSQEKWAPFTGPGHWVDPDMLVVGNVGWGNPHPSRLTPDEQYAHLSLWCLLAAPLLIGCDIASMDDFTVGLLSNDEVLEIDQDSLGRQAVPVAQGKDTVVYGKPLEDGSWVVGLFNRSESPKKVSVKWSDIKRMGSQRVRDLWKQQDLGVFAEGFSAEVGRHGVVLVRIFPSRS